MRSLKNNGNKNALVYLLRPTEPVKLNEIIEKTGAKGDVLKHFNPLTFSGESLNLGKAPTRFLIHTRDDTKVILYDEVVFCVADSNYTLIHLRDGHKVMVSKTLKDVQAILHHPQFFRIHASYLINLNFIKRILKTDRCAVELPNNVILDVSRSRRSELMYKMESL